MDRAILRLHRIHEMVAGHEKDHNVSQPLARVSMVLILTLARLT
jgi:hypothetical protein